MLAPPPTSVNRKVQKKDVRSLILYQGVLCAGQERKYSLLDLWSELLFEYLTVDIGIVTPNKGVAQ